jgi:uncharacterized membrane protein
MKTKNKTLVLVQFSILLAIEAIFCFTPLGSLPAIGPIVATLAMIPVLITAMMLGTGAGALMGFFTGLFSFLVWTFMPPNPLTAFIFTPFYSAGDFHGSFWSLVICFVPRVMVGVVTGALYKLLTKHFPNKAVLRYGLSGFCGSLVNTILVLGGILVFFGGAYSSLIGGAIFAAAGLTVLTSGIPEAVIGALVSYAVCKPVAIMLKKRFR